MLKKKRPKGFIAKVWQDRHFVLYDDVLQYFKKKTDVTPCGMIPIQAITSVTTEWKQKKNPCRFDIEIGDKRTFCLQADSVNEKNIWVQKIKGLMSNLDDTSGLQLEIDTRGKFWKNTNEIREARARSSVNWGDRRYLMADTTDDTKSSSDNSVSEDHDSKDHEQADTKFQVRTLDFIILFYFILFYFILFYFIFILFSFLFYFILFYFIFIFILFYFILFYFILLGLNGIVVLNDLIDTLYDSKESC